MKYLFYVLVAGTLFSACNNNNVTENKSLGKFFEQQGVTGSFGLFDNGKGTFTVFNLSRFRDSAYLPASTFKIVNGLIGLETGRVTDEKMVIKWDGVTRSIDNWNQDLTMEQAFRYSAVPWYQELARRIGEDTMQHFLDTLGYAGSAGKAVIKDNLDTFWLDNSIKITADEQLGLVKKLYFNQLPFQPRSQKIVQKIMVQEDNSNYILAYKTGWGTAENGHAIAWVVGWVEENRHPYFFALNIEDPNPDADIPAKRMAILKGILKELGFLEGKM
ncbi:MAG: penicillin-binding transpeptidase domain-containing protein [Chitinophagaceae bacterium]